MPFHRKSSNITVDQYLELEERASVRHEYVDGQIFAMTGVRYRHNLIAGNIFAILRSHVLGSRCRALISDVKVRVEATNSIYYPDVMVACGHYDNETVIAPNPVLIAEVLSRSTAAIDRREKLFAYRQIDTLKEYLIVHQRKQMIEMHHKNKEGHWEAFDFLHGAEIVLESIPTGPLTISLAAIYEDVDCENDQAFIVHEEIANGGHDEDDLDW